MIEHNTRLFINNALGDHNMSRQPLIFFAVKMNKAAHRVQKSLGNGKTKSKSSRKTAASCVCLIKDIVHLCQLRICHTYTGVTDIDNQINTIILMPVFDPNIYAALFCKLNGIFHQDFEYMGYLLRVSDEYRRYMRVDIKHHFQMLPVALQCSHCDHIVQHRSDHIFVLGRSQSAFQNLCIVQHIVDLVRQALSRQLYGRHIRPNIRR